MNNLRVGLVQLASYPGDKQRNLERISSFSAEAATAGADVVCFPELSVTGYGRGDSMRRLAEPVLGASTRTLEEIARACDITILAGLLELRGTAVLNTHVVVKPAGLVGTYSKVRVPRIERLAFDPGSEVRLFEHEQTRFGIQICYDAHYPELSAAMADDGAEVLFLPHASAGQEPRGEKLDRWMRFLPARAYDNTLYVAVCNASGVSADGDPMPGICLVFDPLGRVIAASETGGEELLVVDLDAGLLTSARAIEGSDFRAPFRAHAGARTHRNLEDGDRVPG